MNMYDTLADYLGGALDGTPEREAVAARIATDPAWRMAYENLVVADAAVRSDLSALAAEPTVMPADVEARISAALLAAAGQPPTGLRAGRVDSDVPTRPLIAPADRRRSRWALAGGALAVGLLTVGGIGILVDTAPDQQTSSTLSDDKAAPPAALATTGGDMQEQQGLQPDAAGVHNLASGRNYTRQELSTGPQPAAAAPSDRDLQPVPAESGRDPQPVPAELNRLRDAGALGNCLSRVAAVHGSKAESVDYARFEGRPALIVTLSGTRAVVVVVVGPDCGLTGTDELYPGGR